MNRNVFTAAVLFATILVTLVPSAQTQTRKKSYPLTQFNNEGCMAKGRVQDCSGSVMRQILADGKDAIPVLISQLTETARTKYQLEDYWGSTRSGDVAYVVLTDLFTDADLHTFGMPGVPDWPAVMKGCDSSSYWCWIEYVQKHGRKSVQQAWMNAWNLNKDSIYWDKKAQCFRVSKK